MELLKCINIKLLCIVYHISYYFYRVQRKSISTYELILYTAFKRHANDTPAISQEWLLTILKTIEVSFILQT